MDVLDASASWMVPREVKDVWGEGGAGRESLGTYIRVIKGFVSYWYGLFFFPICMDLRNDCWISKPKHPACIVRRELLRD